MCGVIEQQMKGWPDDEVKGAAVKLYGDLSAIVGHLVITCRSRNKVPSQVAAALLRTLIEAVISVFAFCRDPKRRGSLYLNFAAVLDLKNACADEKHVGCPFVSDVDDRSGKIKEKKDRTIEALKMFGADYVKQGRAGQALSNRLEEALQPGSEKPHLFRETWYPETRSEVLQQEGMGWVYEVLYRRLCSAVHSDTAASLVLSGFPRSHYTTIVLQFWGAGIYKMVDTFRVNLPAEHKGILRLYYKSWIWP